MRKQCWSWAVLLLLIAATAYRTKAVSIFLIGWETCTYCDHLAHYFLHMDVNMTYERASYDSIVSTRHCASDSYFMYDVLLIASDDLVPSNIFECVSGYSLVGKRPTIIHVLSRLEYAVLVNSTASNIITVHIGNMYGYLGDSQNFMVPKYLGDAICNSRSIGEIQIPTLPSHMHYLLDASSMGPAVLDILTSSISTSSTEGYRKSYSLYSLAVSGWRLWNELAYATSSTVVYVASHLSEPLPTPSDLVLSPSSLSIEELVDSAVRAAPRLCLVHHMGERRSMEEMKWAERLLTSLVNQRYAVSTACLDTYSTTLGKLQALREGLKGDNSFQHTYAWNDQAAKILGTATLSDWSELPNSSVGLVVVILGRRIEEQSTRDAILATASTISGQTVSSMVAVLWSDDCISRQGGDCDSRQLLINIAQRDLRGIIPAQPFALRNTLNHPVVSLNRHRRVILLTHMYNEEFLLPHWIRHHAPHFDMAILLDYNSSDASLRIISEQAPSSWRVVQSKHSTFVCKEADEELMAIERMYPDDWKIVLTLGEFLVIPDLRGYLASDKVEAEGYTVLRFPSYTMIDNDGHPPLQFHHSLVCGRSQYTVDPSQPRQWFGLSMYSRFIHRNLPDKVSYGSGRHYLLYEGDALTDTIARDLEQASLMRHMIIRDGPFIAKYKWSPWPESIARMIQIHDKINEIDRSAGTPHLYGDEASLVRARNEVLEKKYISDFRHLGLLSDALTDFRIAPTVQWLEVCHMPPLLQRNIDPLNNVSDVFSVAVRYIKGTAYVTEYVHAHFSDLLYESTSEYHKEKVTALCTSFCTDVLRHVDIPICTIQILNYLREWVFGLNMIS